MKRSIILKLIFLFIVFLLFNCLSFNKYIKYTYKNLKEINENSNIDKNNQNIEKQLEDLNVFKSDEYRICINDSYNIFVDSNSNFTTMNAIVKSDGYITIKRIGEVKIVDLTLEEAKEAISEKIKDRNKSPVILSIIPISVRKAKGIILGEVKNPGSYNLEGNTKVLDLISMAGGINETVIIQESIPVADIERAFIIRQNEILPVNFVELIQHGNLLHNILIKDKDYIYIPSMSNNQVYIFGQIAKPGKYMKYIDMTLCELISTAGGILEGTASTMVSVVRKEDDYNKSKIYHVNIKKIIKEGMPDFRLRTGDIIYVSKSIEKDSFKKNDSNQKM